MKRARVRACVRARGNAVTGAIANRTQGQMMADQQRLLAKWIEGHPSPMPRPRLGRDYRGRTARMVYTKRCAVWISAVDHALLSAHERTLHALPFSGPLRLSVEYWLPYPSPRGRKAPRATDSCQTGQPRDHWHIATPDLDNLTKLICDRLQHTGWISDDACIAQISATKRHSPPDYTTGCDLILSTLT